MHRKIEDRKFRTHAEVVEKFVGVGDKAFRQARKAVAQAERSELYAKQAFLRVSLALVVVVCCRRWCCF